MSKIYVDEIAGIASPSTVAIPGHVIQAEHHEWSTETSISTSTWTDATGSSFTFTPKSATSDLLITLTYVSEGQNTSSTDAGGDVRLLVDGTPIYTPAGYGSYISVGASYAQVYSRNSQEFKYTSGATDALTLKIQFRLYDGSFTRARINPGNGYFSSIKVLEIAG